MSHPSPEPDTPPEVLETEPVPPVAAGHGRATWTPSDLRRRRRVAWTVAIAADAVQLALLPLIAVAWPVGDAIDVIVGIIMLRLLGWHFSFLPSFAVKLLPVVDIVPTWTMAVWLATRKPLPAEPPGMSPPRG